MNVRLSKEEAEKQKKRMFLINDLITEQNDQRKYYCLNCEELIEQIASSMYNAMGDGYDICFSCYCDWTNELLAKHRIDNNCKKLNFLIKSI